MSDDAPRPSRTSGGEGTLGPHRIALTRREREILGMLADGLSGAQIAARLSLSPETVRTHVRNAMAKLGASTRSQAVALALQSREISGDSQAATTAPAPAHRSEAAPATSAALTRMLDGLVELYDVEGGAVYLADEDGLALQRASVAGAGNGSLADNVALGDGPLGRAALDRRAQLLQGSSATPSGGALIAAPIIGNGRLVGVIALIARVSRPVGRNEMLLLQAFATRVGDVLVGGGSVEGRLERAMERFRASWSSATRVS